MARRLRGALATRTQLRIRVLVGVVAVTLAALAAFDFAAVAIMHDYLYGQARSQLNAATPDVGDLQALIGAPTLPSQLLDIWLPTVGKPHAITLPLGAPSTVTSTIAKTITKPGYYT